MWLSSSSSGVCHGVRPERGVEPAWQDLSLTQDTSPETELTEQRDIVLMAVAEERAKERV
jgi:hypothetical protein